MSLRAHFLKKSIFAIFRRLQLRRVLSDWAENCVRASSYPKELPYKFSAQTNNTRRSCNTAKMAIFALKGYSLWFLTIFRATSEKAFLGTFGCSRVLNRLSHVFLSKTRICGFSGDLCTLLYEQFWKWPKSDRQIAKNHRHLLGKKVLKSANFGSKKLKFQTNCWKCTQRVKISWLRNLSKNFRFLSKNCPFWAKLKNVTFWPFFEKVDFGDFPKSPAPPCAVRLSWKFCEGSILP